MNNIHQSDKKHFLDALEENDLFTAYQKKVLSAFINLDSGLSVKDIIRICGLSKQVAYSCLNKLSRDNLIVIKDRFRITIWCLNHEKLNEIIDEYSKKQELMAQMNKSNE